MEEIVIRDMVEKDILGVVQLHMSVFSNFFMTRLGKGFLRIFYMHYLNSNYAICKIAETDSRLIGFIVGNINPGLFFKELFIKKGFLLFLHTLHLLIRHPVLVFRKLIYALYYRGEQPDAVINYALISSLGVLSKFRSNGVGSKLISVFCQAAFDLDIKGCYLTTDKVGNENVNLFYKKNGFQLESTFQQTKNRYLNRYVKILHEENI